MSRPRKVLVIGGGIGGLCLAHGLRAAGVDVGVHERTRTRDDWLQGYRIHINPAGSAALHACLPAAQWAEFEASAGRPDAGFSFLDEQLRTLAFVAEQPGADPVARHRGVSRILLRTALLGGLDDVIVHDHEFTHYETTPDGRVTAWFADGTCDTGDVLVGADGSNSRVRHQYLPHAQRVDTGVLAVAGKHLLDSGAELPAALTAGPANIMPPSEGWMFTAVWRAPQAAAADDRDYVFWAYAAAADRFPPGTPDLDGNGLQQLVLDRTVTWSGDVRRLVAGSDPSTVAAIPIRTMLPVPEWPASTVTLIGDAIHNMTPMAGVGANTALRDAALLARLLGDASDPVAAIADYERQMRDYGFAAVATSARMARQAASDRRLPRAAFRTVLRVAEAVPPVKRMMFAGMGA